MTIEPEPEVARGPDLAGEAIPLEILYEDDAMLALNKQPGLVVHPAAGHARHLPGRDEICPTAAGGYGT